MAHGVENAMANVIFFGKPECAGNARQRKALLDAGHELHVRDLFAEPWRADTLLLFLAAHPPADWFNRSAVRVKSGEINPDALGREEALALLLADPRLIRRPLMVIDGEPVLGWDAQALGVRIGLQPRATAVGEGCPKGHAHEQHQEPASEEAGGHSHEGCGHEAHGREGHGHGARDGACLCTSFDATMAAAAAGDDVRTI